MLSVGGMMTEKITLLRTKTKGSYGKVVDRKEGGRSPCKQRRDIDAKCMYRNTTKRLAKFGGRCELRASEGCISLPVTSTGEVE